MLVNNLILPAFAGKGENKWGIERKDSCAPLPVRVVTTLKGFCMSFKKAFYFEIFYQLFLSHGWILLFRPPQNSSKFCTSLKMLTNII